MGAEKPALLDMLATVSDEAFEQWDKGMRAGKILTALAGRVENYKPEITAVRAALADHAALVAKVAALEAEMWELLHSATGHLHTIGQTTQQVDETPWIKRARAALALAKDA